jgi:hypothetical protein
MTITKNEIEIEIKKLSSFLNRSYKMYRRFPQKLENRIKQSSLLGDFLDTYKPFLKRQRIEWELFALKTRLFVLKSQIRNSKEEVTRKGNDQDATKGGS